MSASAELAAFELNIAGRKIDNRTMEARRFRMIGGELQMQLNRDPSPSERILLMNAATLAMLCEQATADMLEGKACDHENYRRNVQALGAVLIKLGLAKKSRDVTKGDGGGDAFGVAILQAIELGIGSTIP